MTIQLTSFSGFEGAKQLAAVKARRCDAVIYCKTQAEAFCYNKLIEHFLRSGKGTDHLYGVIAICVDQTTSMIEGMHLISQRIPDTVRTSYPFQLQAKKIGKMLQEQILKACGLTTEKELRAVWDFCASRLTFPIEATSTEKETYYQMFNEAVSIIKAEEEAKNKEFTDEVKLAENAISSWFSGKFDTSFGFSDSYGYRKSWKVVNCVDGYRTYSFHVEMEYSETKGIEEIRVTSPSFSHYGFDFIFDIRKDKDMKNIVKRIDMIWEQFSVIMKAIGKAHNASIMDMNNSEK